MCTLIAAACIGAIACVSHAQSVYPAQPVPVVVGFPAGGSSDPVLLQLWDGMRRSSTTWEF